MSSKCSACYLAVRDSNQKTAQKADKEYWISRNEARTRLGTPKMSNAKTSKVRKNIQCQNDEAEDHNVEMKAQGTSTANFHYLVVRVNCCLLSGIVSVCEIGNRQLPKDALR